jgi:hypothetical protein
VPNALKNRLKKISEAIQGCDDLALIIIDYSGKLKDDKIKRVGNLVLIMRPYSEKGSKN